MEHKGELDNIRIMYARMQAQLDETHKLLHEEHRKRFKWVCVGGVVADTAGEGSPLCMGRRMRNYFAGPPAVAYCADTVAVSQSHSLAHSSRLTPGWRTRSRA